MKIHFISIGGSVMHQLAIALHRKGYEVTGSDDEIFEPAKSNLTREGLLPAAEGWFPSKITPHLDAVILGMHAKEDNPELTKAGELGLPVYSFPEYIFRESAGKTRVVVGGSHGKTTTTSMIMHMMKEAGLDFDYLVGAKLEGFDQSVKISDAPLIVCEGDEYPASTLVKQPKFHFLFPHIAVITGIAWDHINVFPTFENYLEQFRLFIEKIEPGGQLVYNATDDILTQLVEENRRDDIEYTPYGIPPNRIRDGVTYAEIAGVETSLKIFGNHNLLNLQAAWLVCRKMNITPRQFTDSMAHFSGASKRLEVLASGENTIFFRDFAHAPSKVRATMEAVKKQFPGRRFLAVLELHTYSSLNADFLQQYRGSMDEADEAAVFFSRHALELKKMPELPPDAVSREFGNREIAVFNNRADLEHWLKMRNYDNAVVVFMSSGNYDGLDVMEFSRLITGQTV